jgi:hypothetical protein
MARTVCQCGAEVIVGRDEDSDELVRVDTNTQISGGEAARYVLITVADEVEKTFFKRVPDEWVGETYVDHLFDCPQFRNGLPGN